MADHRMIEHTQPLEPVNFVMAGEPADIVWQVCLQEDGSLSVHSTGRRQGRLLVQPSSHMSVTITSEQIVKGKP